MSESDHYDVLVIGSGEAGKYLAWTLAAAGSRTAVIERRYVGGSCPNIACLPSKNLIHSARVKALAARGAEFGVDTGPASTDMRVVQQRKQRMVHELIAVHTNRYEKAGVDLIMGHGRFVSAKTVEVRGEDRAPRVLTGERIFLNLGTRAAVPDIPGLRDAAPMTHVDALNLDQLPRHLIVLGGGYVGLELAQAMRRFGAEVTVIEQGAQLAGREDPDVGAALLQLIQDEGIQVLLDNELRQVTGTSGECVTGRVAGPEGERTVEGTHILVAAGRTPNTNDLGAAEGGVELDSRGYVKVNDRLETSAPDVWAMGDCAGSPQFTHVAFDDFRIVRDNLDGGNRTTSGRLVPYCMFTDPALARVGLNEAEAKEKGVAYRTAALPMSSVLRTKTTSEPRGFMKMLIAEENDAILGFTTLGAESSELAATVQTAMLGKLPFTALRDALFTHPTAAEGLTLLLADVESRG